MRRLLSVVAVTAALMMLGTMPCGAQSDTAPDEVDLQNLQDLKLFAGEKGKGSDLRRLPAIIQSGAIDANTYILGPGDGLELNLYGRLGKTIALDVSPEGRVFVPGRGSIEVTGKTLAWARERILKSVAEQYVGVKGDLRLTQLRSFKVFVGGEVKKPGAVEVNSATRASEAILDAGLVDGSSRRNIVVRHTNGSSSRVDLDRLDRVGRQDMNPILVDGDVLSVPTAKEFVDIAGAVSRSFHFELAPDDSLSTLIALAGGLLPSASPDRALVVRFTSPTERESLLVDLKDPATLAMPLRDGDHLFVQFQPEYHRLMTVGIVGEVARPGSYPIVPGRDRLSDLMRWAGGFLPQANREALHLVRESAVVNESNPEIDRLARLSRGDMTESEYAKLETNLAERKNSFRVDWTRLQAGSSTDPLLADADVIRVERFVPTVRIEGQVKRPGFVDYAPGRSLEDYVQLAGGFTERSARTSVRVSRSLTGQIIPARSLKAVQPGDFIWVPERRDVDAWVAFRDIVAVTGQVAVVIFTLSKR